MTQPTTYSLVSPPMWMDRSKRFGFGLGLILVATLAFGAIAASATTAPVGWTTLHAARSPVTVQLPESWQVYPPEDKDERLVVATRNSTVAAFVVMGPNHESWAAFYERLYKMRRTEELARDPHASIRTRVTSLPAGRAFESIVVRYDQSSHERIRQVQLDFLRDGMQYEFQYVCPEKLSGVYVPVFDTSARSIRLTQ